jgi:hypothetical protein
MAACGLGRKHVAVGHLARACEEGDAWLFIIALPACDAWRGDPRLFAIVRRLNLPESIAYPRLSRAHT